MAMPEVIVVGAGVVGCSLAFHLARAGARVTVFDKEREVCAGMSARSGALLRMHYTFAPEAELAWKSLGYFAHWEEMVGRDAERRRSEEHTSELQSRRDLVCRLLLEKKKKKK